MTGESSGFFWWNRKGVWKHHGCDASVDVEVDVSAFWGTGRCYSLPYVPSLRLAIASVTRS
ncbi:hypothetical protein OOK60_06515 [Trichothermofontia sichuanensis B231]|uniref:hypothetical protein n=1 Tax=Trichothermofontia sichuanensis TaxID=3045816 RepID=UPI002246EF49|nr:hypothetical protein [Trichothermofontia sichuanensis]UZQ55718.1 hypothetical protein OOK60_06515 [Trichothermofontia sichuanensis B231]